MAEPHNEHLGVHEQLELELLYPAHPPRTESAVFRATKAHWHAQGAKCIVDCLCEGEVEIHHWYCEWAYANAVDWDKMRQLHPNFDWSTFREPADFVDSIYNTAPLCVKHHRSRTHGIHHVPGPNWNIQQYQQPDFVFCEQDEPK